MNLPSAPDAYSKTDQSNLRREIENADRHNIKRGTDYYVLGGRVILTAPDGSFWALSVDNSGTLSTVAV